jgi:maleylacetate reductase
MEFTYQTFPNKVYFGRAFTTSLELAGKGDTPVLRVFLIASARNKALVEYIQASPQFELVHHFSQIAQHVPVELVDEAAKQLKPDHTDLLLCLGGGSAIGLAKALALRSGLPVWAIPSTYAGSEMTNIYGISVDGKKTVSRHVRVLPQVVVYDPALTATLPLQIALQSAANALAHLVEGVYAVQNNPVSYHQSLVGIRSVLKGYEAVKASQALTPEANEAFCWVPIWAGNPWVKCPWPCTTRPPMY